MIRSRQRLCDHKIHIVLPEILSAKTEIEKYPDARIIEAAQHFLKLDKIFQSDGKKVEQKNAKQKEKFKKPRPLSFTASLSTLIRTRHFSLWKSKLFFVC